MDQIILWIGSILTAITGTGYFTFLFAKSKYKVEVLQAKENAETTAIDNDIKLSGHYKELLDDLKTRYEIRYKEFEDLMNRKMNMLEEELKLKDRKIKLQQQEIIELKKENRILRLSATRSQQSNSFLLGNDQGIGPRFDGVVQLPDRDIPNQWDNPFRHGQGKGLRTRRQSDWLWLGLWPGPADCRSRGQSAGLAIWNRVVEREGQLLRAR